VRPLVGCRTPIVAGKAKLQFKDFDFTEANDKLTWKWVKGAATPLAAFGDPSVGEDYLLCGYDESGPATDVFLRAILPAGATCDGQPCWRPLGTKGFTYKDASDVRPQGIRTVKLVAGVSGKAKIVVKGKGRVLAYRPFGLPHVPPSAPFPVPLRVQLEASNGECWEATYSTVKKAVRGFANSVFKATSD
jgi:hypothetical protein